MERIIKKFLKGKQVFGLWFLVFDTAALQLCVKINPGALTHGFPANAYSQRPKAENPKPIY